MISRPGGRLKELAHDHLDDAQLVELTAAIAQENFRARFNRGFRVPAVRFSAGGFCPVPERSS